MKLFCPFSGIHYSLDTFKLSNFKEQKVPHPFLSFPLNTVLGTSLPAFANETIFGEDLHLFGTYLLLKLPIERWNFALLEKAPLDYWIPFWLSNVEKLASIVKRLDGKRPKDLVSFSVHTEVDLAPLSNLTDWIAEAHISLNAFHAPISEEARKRNKDFRANLNETEFSTEEQCNLTIEKILRGSISSSREKQKFPELIANWAARVGNFPNSVFRTSNGERKTIRNFWKEIIRDAFDLGTSGKGYSNILTSDITVDDLDELQEHCMEHIPSGTLHSRALWEELGKLKEVILEFKSPTKSSDLSIEVLSSSDIDSIMGEVSHVSPAFTILNDDPDMPRKEDYPSLSSFVKAKMAYKNQKEKQVRVLEPALTKAGSSLNEKGFDKMVNVAKVMPGRTYTFVAGGNKK